MLQNIFLLKIINVFHKSHIRFHYVRYHNFYLVFWQTRNAYQLCSSLFGFTHIIYVTFNLQGFLETYFRPFEGEGSKN